MKYRADIDGLRAIAVLSVIFFHFYPKTFTGGFIGVDVFFVISGYLITSIILNDLKVGQFSILDFYRRRIRRIFPALILVTLSSLFLGWHVLFAQEYGQLGKHIASGSVFIANFTLWNESGYFDHEATTKPMLHLWSLAVEEQFYLVWPILLYFAWRWKVLVVALLVVLLSFFANLYLMRADAVAAFYWPVSRMWEPASGGVIAILTSAGWRLSDRWGNAASGLGIVLLMAGFHYIDHNTPFPGWSAMLPVAAAMLIILAGPGAILNRIILSNSVVVFVGLISYPLYLWHWPVLTFMRLSNGEELSAYANMLALLMIFLLSWATYAFVEKGIRSSRSRMVAPGLATALGAVGAAALVIYFQAGFQDRAIERQLDFGAPSDVIASTRLADDSCFRYLKISLLDEEVCLARAADPEVLFVGDSHAMALYSSIYAGSMDLNAALIAAHACQPYASLGYEALVRRAYGNNCAAISRKMLAMATSLDSTRTIVISSSFFWLDDRMSGYQMDGRGLTHKEAFLLGMRSTVEAFLKTGKRIVLVLDVPHLKYMPENCIQRVALVDSRKCGYDLEEHKRFRDEYMNAISKLRAQYPGLNVFDPTSMFCDGSVCHSKHDGRQLYLDRHHISPHASRLILGEMRGEGLLDRFE